MKRIEYFELITNLFKFKTIIDEKGNEYVLFEHSFCEKIKNIQDKTEFEASENHVHLIDNINKDEFERLVPIAKSLGQALLNCLKCDFSDKEFVVYVSIHLKDSMTIRFHQKWENEEPYCWPEEFMSEKEKVFAFET